MRSWKALLYVMYRNDLEEILANTISTDKSKGSRVERYEA
jgi:hypothetical protein